MFTRNDITLVEAVQEPGYLVHKVQAEGKNYVLCAANLTEDDVLRTMEMEPMLGIMYALGSLPMVETYVAKADQNFELMGECNEECRNGICTRRLASTEEYGDIERAYETLLNYLNG